MIKERTIDDIGNHSFIQQCFSDGIAVSKALGKTKPFSVTPSWKRDPYEDEFYKLGVSSSAATLLSSCQLLSDSLLYISAFNPSARMRRHGITRQRQIQFAVENFIIRAVSIYDKLLMFTNAVFHLGISDECIGHVCIVTNVHVQVSGIVSKLKAIRKISEKYNLMRNELVHHREYQDDDLRRLQGLSIISRSRLDDGFDLDLRVMTLKYARDREREYETHVKKILSSLYDILTDMEKVYVKKVKILSPNQAVQPTGKAGG